MNDPQRAGALYRRPCCHIDQFDIDTGTNDTLPSARPFNSQRNGTAYVWDGGNCRLIPIPREGDADFDKKMRCVTAALKGERE